MCSCSRSEGLGQEPVGDIGMRTGERESAPAEPIQSDELMTELS